MLRFASNGLRLALILALAGCATSTSPPPATAPVAPATPPVASPEVLARVGGEAITVDEFRREMERRGGRIPGQYASVEQRRVLLDEMLRNKAALARAREAGLDQQPETRLAIERLLVAGYLEAELEPALAGLSVTDEEIAAFYAAHRDEYQTPERRRVAWIFFQVGAKAEPPQVEKVRQRAVDARAEAERLPAGTRNFGEIAQRLSEDPSTRYVGGELGWLTRDQAAGYRWGPELVEAAFALAEPGSLSPVLRHERGFYVLKLVAREEAAPAPLEKLASGIRARLLKERREAARESFYQALLAGLTVQVDEARLSTIAPLSGPVPPPAAPPSLPKR